MTTFKLNTGATIPALGFGTWQDADAQETAVLEALKAGYRHIDTARVYGTEAAVGRRSRNPIWNNKQPPDDITQALQDSLNDLDHEYVDLLLIHWPVAFKRGTEQFPKTDDGKPAVADTDYLDTYKAMEKLLSTGKVKAIGLEGHPWLQQRDFADRHKKYGINVTHYSPFGNQNEVYSQEGTIGRIFEDPVLVEIGKKYNKSAAQSKTPERIKANLEGDFKLEEDVKKIRGIDRKLRFNDSSKDFGYEFFKDLDGKK
ncbi:Aldo/keto reductase [Aspergillus spinulosporus]